MTDSGDEILKQSLQTNEGKKSLAVLVKCLELRSSMLVEVCCPKKSQKPGPTVIQPEVSVVDTSITALSDMNWLVTTSID